MTKASSLDFRSEKQNGAVVQLVRILACHARGRGFESRPHRRGVFHQWKTPCFLRTTLTCGPSDPEFPSPSRGGVRGGVFDTIED